MATQQNPLNEALEEVRQVSDISSRQIKQSTTALYHKAGHEIAEHQVISSLVTMGLGFILGTVSRNLLKGDSHADHEQASGERSV